MGWAKRQMEEEWANGWSSSDEHVCSRCVDDDALANALDAAADPDEACDFCGSSPAAEIDVLLGLFVDGLKTEYGNADDEGVYYDGREGGYQWHRIWTSDELVFDLHYDVLIGPGLAEAVAGAMLDTNWVEIDFAGPRRDEALIASWERFRTAVMYETRYVFWLRPDQGDEFEIGVGEVSAGHILNELGALIEDDRLGLLRELPAGTRLWRARAHDEHVSVLGGPDLGTVPRELATRANRMSPAGIPMFYGAVDAETAVAETMAHDDRKWATVGLFETSTTCLVIDFTRLPPVPSMFDPDWRGLRRAVRFLQRFVEDLRQPARPTHDQIDYVPTQIVTEYLIRIFGGGSRISGLLFSSTVTGNTCSVLDVPHDRCFEPSADSPGPPLSLSLVAGSVETRSTDPHA